MKCVGIIWNVAFQFRREIVQMISKEAVSIDKEMQINLEDHYEEFVRDIYSCENMEDWKIEKKILYMKSKSPESVYVVIFEIDLGIQRYHEKKKKFVYSNLQDLKDMIRDSYKHRVNNYFFDIIFHCTETDKEFNNCYSVIEKYVE